MKDIRDFNLKGHNTFGIDAKCSRFLEYESVDEAREVAEILRETAIPYIIIGGGSNLLLTKDFEGIVVHSAMKGVSFGNREMCCGSGEVWDDMVALSIRRSLYGMENLSLIPGDVGASAVQNIGAYGVEIKDMLLELDAVEIATGEVRPVSITEISVRNCGGEALQTQRPNNLGILLLQYARQSCQIRR